MIKKNETYPLADHVSAEVATALGLDPKTTRFCATPTGEFRAPSKGEWYLSGAIVEAYQAYSDYAQPYHIARLVPAKRV